jgi:hypothetical protein
VTGFFDLITKVPFETEEDLRATFNFLLEFPREFKCMGFGEMTNFPTYDFSRQVSGNNALIVKHQQELTEEVYDYYHKLYLLTRGNMPKQEIIAVSEDPRYRENPDLLDALIKKEDIMSFTGISF